VIKKAAEEVAAWNTKTMQEEDEQLLQSLKSKLKMVTPTPEEQAKATEAMKPLWDKWAADRDQTTRDVLAKIRAALGK
jgi:TRAP-type C4-dicarboxylate transport system substrate-binding protein